MTRKDLTWKLKAQPTAGEIADLVKHKVLTPDEARAIIFNKGKQSNEVAKTTVVTLLLDTSGSMESVRDATISGYNEYINSLKEDGGKFKVSLTLFDTGPNGKLRLDQRHQAINIDDVPELTRETFRPDGGTPLYDAFCTTLNGIHDRPDEKYLFVVLTDGGENASREYSEKQLAAMKQRLEDKGNWTFVYVGANQDSWATASKWGFSASNVSNYNSTTAGTSVLFASLGKSTRSFSASPAMASTMYFTEEQKKENAETK